MSLNTITHGRTVAKMDKSIVYQVWFDGVWIGSIHLGRVNQGWIFSGDIPLDQPADGWAFLNHLIAMIDQVAASTPRTSPVVEESGLNGTYRIYRDGQGYRGVCAPLDGTFWNRRSADLGWLISMGRFNAGVKVGTPMPEALLV